MKNLQLTKWLCIILIIALLPPIGSLVKEIFFTSVSDDGSLSAVLFFLFFSAFNYFITIRYCNRLINKRSIKKGKNNFLFFLIMSVITFACSALTFVLFSFGFYEMAISGKNFPPLNGILDKMIFAGFLFYGLVGPVVFLCKSVFVNRC